MYQYTLSKPLGCRALVGSTWCPRPRRNLRRLLRRARGVLVLGVVRGEPRVAGPGGDAVLRGG